MTGQPFAHVSKPLAVRHSNPFPPRSQRRGCGCSSVYNERVPGLGEDFRAELIAAVEWIAVGPEVWPLSAEDAGSA
jgi:hypothetical protein